MVVNSAVFYWSMFSWFLIMVLFRIFFDFSWWIVTGPLWAPAMNCTIRWILGLTWLVIMHVVKLNRAKREDGENGI